MKVLYCIAFCILFAFDPAWALDDYRAIAIEAERRAPEQMIQFQKDAKNAKNAMIKSMTQAEIVQNESKSSSSDFESIHNNQKRSPSILIFVSFSMPSQSLEAYLRDAKKIHASVVIRGLIDNSFQKTFKQMAALITKSGGDGVELNPFWFKRFGIKSVPAVVIVPFNSQCMTSEHCNSEKDFDVMTGDINLAAALSEISHKGHLTSDIAQSALAKLQDRAHA